MPRREPEARPQQPPNGRFLDKLKLWVWNSYKTFMAPFDSLNKEISGAIWFFPTLALAIVGAILGGLIGSIPYLPGSFVGGLLLGGAVGAVVAFVPSIIVVAVTSSVIKLATVLTAGVVGAVVGLVTSFGLLLTNPHSYWLRRDAAEREQLAASIAALSPPPPEEEPNPQAHARVLNIIQRTRNTLQRIGANTGVSLYPTPAEFFTRFETFDPNAGLTSVADPSQRNPVIDLATVTVVKASNGKYYNRQELDQSHQEGHNPNITYDPNSDIVNDILKVQFEENETECAISFDALTKENAVRSRFGIYYDRANIQRWIGEHHTCPANRFFLDNTTKYLQPIDRSRPEPVARQATTSRWKSFMGLSSRSIPSSNVFVPTDSTSNSYDGPSL